ncbi:unnamed protein product [Oppiella nova]|uniref:Uncharacterized protein n=1 Tax=Oppiella nova TaxID=334625 RepID=A0A7R9MAT2_9ACAR|nr:unnamed protein product [Oppiella nova]CAG2173697.1 unnamed protein product [Oppiella nova]
MNGSVDIPFNIVKDLDIDQEYQQRYRYDIDVEFTAVVREGVTGKEYTKCNSLTLYHKDYKVGLMNKGHFKPGLKYTALFKVVHPDDTPVDDNGPPVALKYGYSYHNKQLEFTESLILQPIHGLIRAEIYPPKDAKALRFYSTYMLYVYLHDYIDSAESPTGNYIQVERCDVMDVRVGQEVKFCVTATEPLTRIVYEVIGGGDIVLTHSLDIPGNSNSYEFSVMAVHRMAPKARILCYYVREDNEEVVADAMDFEVDGLFRTEVSIDTDLKEAEPGAQVAVRVNTKPDAWVGIVGVDQSVLLLKSGNDMTHKDVIQKLQTYDTTGINTFWGHNSSTAEQVFDNSGVVVVSNGFIYENEVYSLGPGERSQSVRSQSIVWRSLHDSVKEVCERSVSQSAPLDRQSQSKPTQTNVGISVKTRKHFPETWLWTSMQTGSNGCAVIKSTIPDTITSWVISAFAMHIETGLGIAPTPSKVTVFRPFFIKLSLPYSIIRGETVAIEAIVFNYTTKPIQSEVVFDNKKQEFEFSDRLHTKGVNISEMRQLVSIPANDGVSVTFTITPKTMGYIDIKLTANSAMAGDSVLRKLLVKPEGQTQHFNQSVLVDLLSSLT